MASRAPARPTEKKETPLGFGGVAQFGGFLVEEEQNPELTGTQKYRKYSQIMANTAIAAAGIRYFLNMVGKAKWSMEPADDSAEAKKWSEFAEEVFDEMDTPWHRVARRASMYRFHGYSVQEWVAKRREDGRIVFQDIAPRPQTTIERWDLDKHGRVFGMWQRSPQTSEEVYLPLDRLLYVVDDSMHDSPEGLGLFRHMVKHADTLANFEKLETYGFEGDLRGIPIGRAPLQAMSDDADLTEEDVTAILKPMRDFLKNHIRTPQLAMLLDSQPYSAEGENATPSNVRQWDIDLLKSESGSQTAVANAIERLNREIARLLGVEHLLLGDTGGGSLALARDKSHNFALFVDGALTEIAEAARRHILTALWELNGAPKEMMPRFTPQATEWRDIEQVTGAILDMANSGALLAPDDPAIDGVRDLLGLPRPLRVLSVEPTDPTDKHKKKPDVPVEPEE